MNKRLKTIIISEAVFMKSQKSITTMLIFIVSAELAGVLSALLSGGMSGFFAKYEPPPLLPPSIVFPIVWTVLYALMGLSAYLVYSSDADSNAINRAMTLYVIQLIVNFSWSIIFFRFEMIWLAAAVILLLIVLVAAMTVSFKRIRPAAGYMNIPYLVWLIIAFYLNIATAIVNR